MLLAGAILSGPGMALTIDLRELYSRLYGLAATPPSLALLAGAAPPPPGPAAAAAASSWVRMLESMLLSRAQRHLQVARLAAFAKRLLAAALHSEVGEALGALGVARDLCARDARLRSLLEQDEEVRGSYDPDAEEPEAAGAQFACAWELCLLGRHGHCAVADAARELSALPLGDALVMPRSGPLATPHALALAFSTAAGGFRPDIPALPLPGRAAASKAARRAAVAKLAADALPAGAEGVSFCPFFSEMKAHGENASLRRALRRTLALQAAMRQRLEERRRKKNDGAAGRGGAGGGTTTTARAKPRVEQGRKKKSGIAVVVGGADVK